MTRDARPTVRLSGQRHGWLPRPPPIGPGWGGSRADDDRDDLVLPELWARNHAATSSASSIRGDGASPGDVFGDGTGWKRFLLTA